MSTHPQSLHYGTSTHFLHTQLILKTSPPTLVIFPLPAFQVRDRKMVCAKKPGGIPCCITNPEIWHVYEFIVLAIKWLSKQTSQDDNFFFFFLTSKLERSMTHTLKSRSAYIRLQKTQLKPPRPGESKGIEPLRWEY